jgi:hypothetical protein
MKMKLMCATTMVLAWVSAVNAGLIFEDHFNDEAIDSSIWTATGNVRTGSGSVLANGGGSIRSNATQAVSEGAIDVKFANVGTDDWSTTNESMGLYNVDHTQYVELFQADYGDYSKLNIKGPSGSASYVLEAGFWGMYNVELRDPTCSQTWNLVLDANSVKLYVNDVLKVSFSEGQNLGETVGWPHSGIVSIPTAALAVEFRGSSSGNFKADAITAVPEPASLMGLLGLAGLFFRRK